MQRQAALEQAWFAIESAYKLMNLWAENPYGDGIGRHEAQGILAEAYARCAPAFNFLKAEYSSMNWAGYEKLIEERAREIEHDAIEAAEQRLKEALTTRAEAEQHMATIKELMRESLRQHQDMLINQRAEFNLEMDVERGRMENEIERRANELFEQWKADQIGSWGQAGGRVIQL